MTSDPIHWNLPNSLLTHKIFSPPFLGDVHHQRQFCSHRTLKLHQLSQVINCRHCNLNLNFLRLLTSTKAFCSRQQVSQSVQISKFYLLMIWKRKQTVSSTQSISSLKLCIIFMWYFQRKYAPTRKVARINGFNKKLSKKKLFNLGQIK